MNRLDRLEARLEYLESVIAVFNRASAVDDAEQDACGRRYPYPTYDPRPRNMPDGPYGYGSQDR